MEDSTDIITALQAQVQDLSDAIDQLNYAFYRKTGPASASIQGSFMQSVNFKTGSTGWQLTPDGNLEANSGTFRGALVANSLDIPDTTTANSFHVNTAGDTWWGATTFGSAVASVSKAGVGIFTNVTATGTIQASAGFIGTATALVYESTGVNTGTSGHVRGGQTDYNTGVGFFLGYSGAAYKFSIGDPNGDYLTWNGSNLTTNKFTLTGIGSFGGNGTDGALTISSGTTTINLGNAAVVTKNYTSISITGTGQLAFSNPNTNGTLITLKSQGGVTLTSSTIPNIDASGMGAAGGTGGTGGINSAAGNDGTAGSLGANIQDDTTTHPGQKGIGATNVTTPGTASTAGTIYTNIFLYTRSALSVAANRSFRTACGSGGGGGGGGSHDYSSGTPTGGNGGNGGAGLIIECAGALNFTSTLGISVAGAAGANAANINNGINSACGGGGGGGGAAGFCVLLYNTLTANTGTINTNGGVGGNGGNATGGASGGSTGGAGGSGGAGAGADGGKGGAGGAGAYNSAGANGTNGTAGDGRRAGGGGGGGASRPNSAAGGTSTGGTGGASGGTESVLVLQNLYFG